MGGRDMGLPQDPVMLLSYVNTQLRDNYGSLDELCASLMAEKGEIIEKLKNINYEYDADKNAFV